MTLIRITDFDNQFENIDKIIFHPFVGENFKNNERRIMIYAHNIPVPSEKFDEAKTTEVNPTNYTYSMGQYLNKKKNWNKSFRNFIKASVGFTSDYKTPLEGENLEKIGNFVSKISHINYINGIVKSETNNNAIIDIELLKNSIEINNKILDILEITHIVCWGKNVFNYIIQQEKVQILESWDNFDRIEGLKKSKGYGYAKIILNGKEIHILKTFHPSMPSFRQYYDNTHKIFNWFYSL